MDPVSWLHDDQLVEADGIVFGPGFIWPSEVEVGATQLDGQSLGTSTVVGTLETIAELDTSPTGDSIVEGTLFEPQLISSAGRSYIALAYLDNGFNELSGLIIGEGYIGQSILFQSHSVPYKPIPYPLDYGDITVNELEAIVYGEATTHSNYDRGFAQIEIPPETALSGDSTVEGTLSVDNFLDGESFGDSVVQGELFVGGLIVELDGQSIGSAEVVSLWDPTRTTGFNPNARWIYYDYGNIIAGFDPTDHVGGTDGDIKSLNKFLALYTNINVGFDYTDDASANVGFVSQTYPDGDIIRDFARHKYQYLLVIPGIEPPDCRLTVGPTPRGQKDLTPTPRPPRKIKR